jgi:hypothetical protein
MQVARPVQVDHSVYLKLHMRTRLLLPQCEIAAIWEHVVAGLERMTAHDLMLPKASRIHEGGQDIRTKDRSEWTSFATHGRGSFQSSTRLHELSHETTAARPNLPLNHLLRP